MIFFRCYFVGIVVSFLLTCLLLFFFNSKNVCKATIRLVEPLFSLFWFIYNCFSIWLLVLVATVSFYDYFKLLLSLHMLCWPYVYSNQLLLLLLLVVLFFPVKIHFFFLHYCLLFVCFNSHYSKNVQQLFRYYLIRIVATILFMLSFWLLHISFIWV